MCDGDKNFVYKYLNVSVGQPSHIVSSIPYHTIPYHTILTTLQEELGMEKATTPMQCRLRNLNYSAPIVADIEYTRGNDRVKLLNQVIGRMRIMLHSNKYVVTVWCAKV